MSRRASGTTPGPSRLGIGTPFPLSSGHGSAGDDRIDGLEGNDKLYGGAGSDVLNGGAGNDELYDVAGAVDILSGGDGDDYLVANRGSGSSQAQITLDGGAGNDRIFFYGHGLSVTVNAGEGADTVELGTLSGTASITLGSGQDTFLMAQNQSYHWQSATVRFTDFETGQTGDKIDWGWFLGATLQGWDMSVANPFATGHLRLVQSGTDTFLQIDKDGGANAFTTLFTFSNTTASALNAYNLGGYAPSAAVFGTPGNDVLAGSTVDDFIYGYAGSDFLSGGGGR